MNQQSHSGVYPKKIQRRISKINGKRQIPWSTRRQAWHCCCRSWGNGRCMPPHEMRTDSPGTRQTFVGNVISLLFNMVSRLVITFLPRSKCLLISWLQSSSTVILEPPKIKCGTVSTVSPSICHEVIGPDAMTLVFWMLSFNPTFSLPSHFLQEAF